MGQAFVDIATAMHEDGQFEITPRNRRFFEIALGELPQQWKAALADPARGRVLVTHEDPLFQSTLHRLAREGVFILSRIPTSGISPGLETSEQFQLAEGREKRRIGVLGLAWNCAELLGSVAPGFREAQQRGLLTPPPKVPAPHSPPVNYLSVSLPPPPMAPISVPALR